MFRNNQTDTTTYNYCYTDENSKPCCLTIHAGESGWTEVTIASMQKFDHEQSLADRYYEEAKDALTEWQKKKYQDSNDDEFKTDPMNELSDGRDDIETQLFAEAAETDDANHAAKLEKLRTFIASLSPDQYFLYEELYIKKKSMRSLANEIGIVEGTVRYRHKKLISYLKKLFEA